MKKVLHYSIIFLIGSLIGAFLDPIVNPTPANWCLALTGLLIAIAMQVDFNNKGKGRI